MFDALSLLLTTVALETRVGGPGLQPTAARALARCLLPRGPPVAAYNAYNDSAPALKCRSHHAGYSSDDGGDPAPLPVGGRGCCLRTP